MLVLLLVAFDWIGGVFLRRIYPESTANPVARVQRAGPHTVILGSSTAKYGLEPAALGESVYNAAENGQTIFFAAAFLRRLPQQSSIRRVVLGLDLPDLVEGYQAKNMRYLKKYSVLATGDPHLLDQLSVIDPFIKVKFLSGLYPFRGQTRRVIYEWLVPAIVDDGYQPLIGAGGEAGRIDSRPPTPAPPESVEGLRQVIAAAELRRLQLVVLAMPWMDEPFPADTSRFSNVIARFRRLLAETDACDLTTVRVPGISKLAGDPSNFKDREHLNGVGARRYGALVADLIDEHCTPVIE